MIMTKVINSLFVIIAAMVTFAGCAKQEIDAPATPETKTVQFFANSIETKTEFGTPTEGVYPTLWSEGDKVDVSVNFAQKKSSSEVECSDDFKSARFEVDLSGTEVEAPYTFYSVSPVDRLRGISSQNKRFYVEILSAQKPLATSVDKDAQLLFAKSSTTEEMPSSVELTYHHLTAYGKFSLTNLAAESVSSIILEAEFDIAGKWDYFLENGSFVVRSGNGSKSITLTTSSTTDIWFACAPVDMTGQKMTLTVTTEKGNFVKVLNFPADKERKFEAGKISKFTVDMIGITAGGSEEPEQPGETTGAWTLVTDASTLAVGDKVVIAAPEADNAMGADKGNNRNVASVSKSGNTLEITENVEIITLQAGNLSNTFALNTSTGYLYAASSNSNYLKTKSTLDNNGSWSISVASDGLATITAKGNYTRNTMRYNPNNGSPLFACYAADKTTGTLVSIYKYVGTNEGGGETPEPKVLKSIAVSGATTNYVVGNEFKRPTVTATYNDETTADVTASATFSGYNMTVAGTYTVTVSYTEGEKTATATYQITVVESQNLPEGIASIKSKAISTNDTEFAVVLTDAVVTYVSGSNAYIEDAEAGILIYKSGHGLKAGDKLNGEVSGKVKLYSNLREITDIDYSQATKTEGAEVPVTEVTLAQLNGAYDKYENMRIKIVDAHVSAEKQISQGDQTTYALYFKGQSLTGFDVYNIIDVIGYPTKYNSNIQLNVWENAVVKGATKTTITGISDVTVKVGETKAINAKASSGAKVSYVSAHPSVAKVGEDGTVTGVAEGSTTITVSVPAYNGYPAAEEVCNVTVTAASQGGGDEGEKLLINMAIAGNTGVKSADSNSISWTQNDFKCINEKASSSTAIRTSDSDHYRIYKNSILKFTAPSGKSFNTIVVSCPTTGQYLDPLKTSAENAGYTVSVSGKVVTISTPDYVSEISITASAQFRISRVEVELN